MFPSHDHLEWAFKTAGFTWKDPYHQIITKYRPLDSIPCDSFATVGAVLEAVSESKTYKDVLIHSVAYGGDVDSVAALAMGVASVTPHIKKLIPIKLRKGLENGQFGYDYCMQLDNYMQKYIDVIRKSKESKLEEPIEV